MSDCFSIFWYSSSSNDFICDHLHVNKCVFFLSLVNICLFVGCLFVSARNDCILSWWEIRPISLGYHHSHSHSDYYCYYFLYENISFLLCQFADYPFGHYKPLIISVFVRGYWYLLTLKLTNTHSDTHANIRTHQMTPKQFQRYLLLSHSVFCFQLSIPNGIHQIYVHQFFELCCCYCFHCIPKLWTFRRA